MNTPNIVLMCILCVIIGFAIGNVWGKEVMKRTFSELLNKLTEGMKLAAGATMKDPNKKE